MKLLLLYSILLTIVWFLVPQATGMLEKPRENYSHTQIHWWQALAYVNPCRYKSETPTATRHAFAPTIWGHHQAFAPMQSVMFNSHQRWFSLYFKHSFNFYRKGKSMKCKNLYNFLKMRFELHIVKLGSEVRMAIKIWTPFFAPLLSRSQSACHFQKSSRPLLTRMAHGICTSCPMPNTYNLYCKKKTPNR